MKTGSIGLYRLWTLLQLGMDGVSRASVLQAIPLPDLQSAAKPLFQ